MLSCLFFYSLPASTRIASRFLFPLALPQALLLMKPWRCLQKDVSGIAKSYSRALRASGTRCRDMPAAQIKILIMKKYAQGQPVMPKRWQSIMIPPKFLIKRWWKPSLQARTLRSLTVRVMM